MTILNKIYCQALLASLSTLRSLCNDGRKFGSLRSTESIKNVLKSSSIFKSMFCRNRSCVAGSSVMDTTAILAIPKTDPIFLLLLACPARPVRWYTNILFCHKEIFSGVVHVWMVVFDHQTCFSQAKPRR